MEVRFDPGYQWTDCCECRDSRLLCFKLTSLHGAQIASPSGSLQSRFNWHTNIYSITFSDYLRDYKLRFISTQLNIRSLLQKQDKAIFKKVKQRDNHPLKVCLPQETNNLTYNLRRKSCQRPKINTERYKNTFVNRLIFKYSLLWYVMSDMCN